MSVQFDTLLKALHVLNITIAFKSPLIEEEEEPKAPLLFGSAPNIARKASIFVNAIFAGELQEIEKGTKYRFVYDPAYTGPSVSLTMPKKHLIHDFNRFPPFFEGLLPEGMMLDALLRQTKIDHTDYLSQLITVGGDLVGNVTVEKGHNFLFSPALT